MSEQNPKNRIDPTAAGAAGRELIDTALQHNPVIAIATALLVPVLSLFRRRGRPTIASVEKMKLESYSYRPLDQATAGGSEARGGPGRRAVEGIQKGTPKDRGTSREGPPSGGPRAPAMARKGGYSRG